MSTPLSLLLPVPHLQARSVPPPFVQTPPQPASPTRPHARGRCASCVIYPSGATAAGLSAVCRPLLYLLLQLGRPPSPTLPGATPVGPPAIRPMCAAPVGSAAAAYVERAGGRQIKGRGMASSGGPHSGGWRDGRTMSSCGDNQAWKDCQ